MDQQPLVRFGNRYIPVDEAIQLRRQRRNVLIWGVTMFISGAAFILLLMRFGIVK